MLIVFFLYDVNKTGSNMDCPPGKSVGEGLMARVIWNSLL